MEVQKRVYLCFIDYTKAFDYNTVDNHNHTTNKFEDRWKRSTGDQKHVLGTDSSNASW